uniref:Uncharacterized protein n=1 Tax=Craspedostauros australis TaxID=1486917 RepID=A0A7R9WPL2_9STRA
MFSKPQTTLQLSAENNNSASKLPFWLDPGTRGGAIVLSVLLFVVPIIVYAVLTSPLFGLDGIEVGKYIGIGFTFILTILWVATYIFRVATKDMTYVSIAEQNIAEQNIMEMNIMEQRRVSILLHSIRATKTILRMTPC